MENGKGAMKDVEAAAQLGMSVHTLRQWRLDGKGPEFFRMGRNVRYMPASLEAYIKSNTVKPVEASNKPKL